MKERESRRGKEKGGVKERKRVHREKKCPLTCCILSSCLCHILHIVTHYFIYSYFSILFYIVYNCFSTLYIVLYCFYICPCILMVFVHECTHCYDNRISPRVNKAIYLSVSISYWENVFSKSILACQDFPVLHCTLLKYLTEVVYVW